MTNFSAKRSEFVIPQALMDYGTVMLLEDTPNIKVSGVKSLTVLSSRRIRYCVHVNPCCVLK